MYTHNVYTCAHTSIHSLVRFHVSFHGFILMLDCLKQYKHLSTGLSDLGCLPTKGKKEQTQKQQRSPVPKKGQENAMGNGQIRESMVILCLNMFEIGNILHAHHIHAI